MTHIDHLYTIAIYGDLTTGKSAMLSRYIKGEFNGNYMTTIGVEFVVFDLI